ncbi:ferredoxin [Chryseobacterium koreense]
MVIVTLQRDKCIGCNYCAEFAPEYFRMSKKDGKSVLLKSLDKKGFHTLKTPHHEAAESCEKAAKACPVKIISVKEV